MARNNFGYAPFFYPICRKTRSLQGLDVGLVFIDVFSMTV